MLARRAAAPPVLALALALCATLATACTPRGPGELPVLPVGPGPGSDAGVPAIDGGPIGGDFAVLTIVVNEGNTGGLCTLTVTVTAPGGTQNLVPDAPDCEIDFPATLTATLGEGDLGGSEAPVAVVALARDADGAIAAQASDMVTARLGFATDLFLTLEGF